MCEQACGACAGEGGQVHEGVIEETRGVRRIDRREMLKRGGLAAAALLLAACAVPGTDTTGVSGGPFTLKLSDYPQLANSGGVVLVNNVAVENTGGSYLGLSLVCPHRGGQILQSSNYFQCTVHGATFDLQGNWIGGQPTTNMYHVSVTNNGDGTLTVG